VSRVAFTIFGKDVYWYGILMAIAVGIAVLLALKEAKRKNITQDTVIDLCLVLVPCGIIGARLYYVIFELEQYLADPIRILYIWEGGLAIFGAVIGGAIGLFVYTRRKKISFLRVADIIVPGLVLAQAIGRWGNFFNQEAFGFPITDPSMTWFPYAVEITVPHTFNGVPCEYPFHMATFFYESMWCLLVFLFLWSMRKKFKHDGDATIWYFLLYSAERMFVEGLRGDSLWLIRDVIRVSQALSLVLFVACAAFLLIRHVREKKLGYLIWPSMQTEPLEAAEDAEQAQPQENLPDGEAESDDADPEQDDEAGA